MNEPRSEMGKRKTPTLRVEINQAGRPGAFVGDVRALADFLWRDVALPERAQEQRTQETPPDAA